MFKRPRLSAQSFPVNAGIAGFLLFYAASCSGPQEAADDAATDSETGAVEQVDEVETAGDRLPAVWSTSTLDFPIRSIGIAGGAGSTFAIAYEGGGLQIFNFDGERTTGVSDHDVEALAEGRYAMISGTPVTVFPGIDSAGDLKVWIHGGGLSEAIQYDLQGSRSGSAAGLCAAPPDGDDSILHRVAYWTGDDARTLQVGAIVQSGDELEWVAEDTVPSGQPITACAFGADGAQAFSAPVMGAARLRRLGRETLLTLSDSGDIRAIYTAGESQALGIDDGITIVSPPRPTAIAATGDARGGGYPGGIVVLGGSIGPQDSRAVLVDPSRITMTPISVPPADQ